MCKLKANKKKEFEIEIAYIVATILLLSEIMPIYPCYTKKKLVCIIIIALFNHQPSSYIKCTKSNIHLSCNIKSILDAKYL